MKTRPHYFAALYCAGIAAIAAGFASGRVLPMWIFCIATLLITVLCGRAARKASAQARQLDSTP